MRSGQQGKQGGNFGAQQLIRSPAVLPGYDELPLCPSCGSDAPPLALIGGALWNVCSICSGGAAGSDMEDPWAMPGHACGVCMKVLCAACNQERKVQQLVEEAENSVRDKAAQEQAPLEAQAAAATHELNMTCAELTAALASDSQSRAKALAEATSMKADIARLRAVAAKEQAQRKQRAAGLQSELERCGRELSDVEGQVATHTRELKELAQVEMETEKKAAWRAANEEEVMKCRSEYAEELLEAKAETKSRVWEEENARKAAGAAGACVERLQAEKQASQDGFLMSAGMDQRDVAEARARLDAFLPVQHQEETSQPRRGLSASSNAGGGGDIRSASQEQPKPRGLRKFWGQVKKAAKEVAESIDALDAPFEPIPEPHPGSVGGASGSTAQLRQVPRAQAASGTVATPVSAARASSTGTNAPGSAAASAPSPVAASDQHLEMRRALRACQERFVAKQQRLSEVKGQREELAARDATLQAEARRWREEKRTVSARCGQLRAELGIKRGSGERCRAKLLAQLNGNAHVYRERVSGVLGEMPQINPEVAKGGQLLDIISKQLESIAAAMMDDFENAAGVQS